MIPVFNVGLGLLGIGREMWGRGDSRSMYGSAITLHVEPIFPISSLISLQILSALSLLTTVLRSAAVGSGIGKVTYETQSSQTVYPV